MEVGRVRDPADMDAQMSAPIRLLISRVSGNGSSYRRLGERHSQHRKPVPCPAQNAPMRPAEAGDAAEADLQMERLCGQLDYLMGTGSPAADAVATSNVPRGPDPGQRRVITNTPPHGEQHISGPPTPWRGWMYKSIAECTVMPGQPH